MDVNFFVEKQSGKEEYELDRRNDRIPNRTTTGQPEVYSAELKIKRPREC